MKIGQFKEYKGYTGSIEYDPEDELHYGCLLNIEDHICYHSKSKDLSDLEKRFHNAVDEYIKNKSELHKDNGVGLIFAILLVVFLGIFIIFFDSLCVWMSGASDYLFSSLMAFMLSPVASFFVLILFLK